MNHDCQNCSFYYFDVIAHTTCIACSSKNMLIEPAEGGEVVSREQLLLELMVSRFNKKFSCLRQLAGENGFNAFDVMEAIAEDEKWEEVQKNMNFGEILDLVGRKKHNPYGPTVCPMQRDNMPEEYQPQ